MKYCEIKLPFVVFLLFNSRTYYEENYFVDNKNPNIRQQYSDQRKKKENMSQKKKVKINSFHLFPKLHN